MPAAQLGSLYLDQSTGVTRAHQVHSLDGVDEYSLAARSTSVTLTPSWAARMASGVPQANGRSQFEPLNGREPRPRARFLLHGKSPLDANVQFLTINGNERCRSSAAAEGSTGLDCSNRVHVETGLACHRRAARAAVSRD